MPSGRHSFPPRAADEASMIVFYAYRAGVASTEKDTIGT